MRVSTSLFKMNLSAVSPDHNVGVEIFAMSASLFMKGWSACRQITALEHGSLWMSASLFMRDWSAVPPDKNVGVELLTDIDVALHDGLECVATRTPALK